MSQSSITTPNEKREKRKAEAEETLSKDYKKPKKTLKQLAIKDFTDPASLLPTRKDTTTPTINLTKEICREDITRVIATLERVIDRQDRAQGCLDHLIRLCLQDAQEDSSGDEGVRVSKV